MAIFPVARGANGQPPTPPKLESSAATPDCTPAQALAIPVLRVLCKCRRKGMSGYSSRIAVIRSVMSTGVATPMVSAIASSNGLASIQPFTTSIKRSIDTSPSKGQPKDAAMVTPTPTGVVTSPARSLNMRIRESVSVPWFFWAKVSVATTTKLTSSSSALQALSKPRRFSARPIYLQSVSRRSSAHTSSASAIWGTRFGLTKLVTSMRDTPASTARLINASLFSVDSSFFSFCIPSLGETSIISTLFCMIRVRGV